jgi:RsiW-degrading membrane proteinase PrsW (M82 family)
MHEMVIVDILTTSLWLFLLIRLDVHRKDKRGVSSILKVFFFGFLSVIPTQILYMIYPYWYIEVDSVTLKIFLQEILATGTIEECSKFAVFLLFVRKPGRLKEPLDAVLHAAAVALAFAAIENYTFGLRGGAELVVARSVLSTTGHVAYACIWGFYYGAVRFGLFGRKRRFEKVWIVFAVFPPAFLHGMYNALLDIGRLDVALGFDVVVVLAALGLYRSMIRTSPFRRFPITEWKHALDELKEALKTHPNSLILHRRLAQFYFRAGEYDTALKYLNRCYKLAPGNAYINSLIGATLILSGEVESGEGLLRACYAQLPSTERWMLRRNLKRVLEGRGPSMSGKERYNQFFLTHFLLNTKPRIG